MRTTWAVAVATAVTVCVGPGLLGPRVVCADDARPEAVFTADGFAYPLDDLRSLDNVAQSTCSGGAWLGGLEGYPPYFEGRLHAALDIFSTLEAPIYAVTPGVVDPGTGMHGGFGSDGGQGGVIVIRSTGANGVPYYVAYGHTREPKLPIGSEVKAGEQIGTIGPWDNEIHLHLFVRLRPLPAQGWGTPTRRGVAGRSGCEYAGSPADIVALGYRAPISLFTGQLAAELRVGCGAPDEVRDRMMKRYAAGYYPDLAAENLGAVPEGENHIGRPADDPYFPAHAALRVGDGYLQTFCRHDDQPTGLLCRDGSDRAYWVHGAIWATYASGGGPARFGYPTGEEYGRPDGRAQDFENATIVFDSASGLTQVR